LAAFFKKTLVLLD